MRFGVPEDSDDDDLAFSSPEINRYSTNGGSTSRLPQPVKGNANAQSQLGRSIRSYLDENSEIDLDSEDEVDMLGLDDSDDELEAGNSGWNRQRPASGVSGLMRSPPKVRTSLSKSFSSLQQSINRKGKEREKAQLLLDPTDYDIWLKSTEEAVWRDGRSAAINRRGQLREIAQNARIQLREEQGMKATEEADEISRMLEGMAIRHAKEEEETARKFAEREKKLWADIDAAIQAAEKVEADARAAIAEKDRLSQAEKQRQADLMKQKQEAEAKLREAQAAAAKANAEQAARDAQAQKEAEERAKSGTEAVWREWVDKQRWIKANVIEVTKRNGRAKLKVGMRLITRGLGQIVNTRESINRVTEEICTILVEHTAAPSLPSPTTLQSPPTYVYLLSHIAKALIKQAENEIAAKTEAAFPLARVVMGIILKGHLALAEVLFARLVKKCPWVIPHLPQQQSNTSRAEYEKSTGRGADESLGDYIIRMGGILTLYFAIIQTPLSTGTPDQLAQIPSCLRLPAAWSWMAYIGRTPLSSSQPTAHLISTWILIASPEISRLYGEGQTRKILNAIMQKIDTIGTDTESSRQQLKLAIEQWKPRDFHTARVPE